MEYQKVYIATTVPESSLQALLEAIADAGAGVIGHYTHCSFAVAGVGRFLPDDQAQPAVGTRLTMNEEPEIRVETFCQKEDMERVIKAIQQAHPYEQPVIYALPMLF